MNLSPVQHAQELHRRKFIATTAAKFMNGATPIKGTEQEKLTRKNSVEQAKLLAQTLEENNVAPWQNFGGGK